MVRNFSINFIVLLALNYPLSLFAAEKICPETYASIANATPIYGHQITAAQLTELQARIEKKLGFPIKLEIDEDPMHFKHSITVYDPKGDSIANFEYIRENTTMTVEKIVVYKSEHRKKGMSELLMANFLHRHPDTEKIMAGFKDDNQSVVHSFLEKGYSCQDALKQSPAYKMRVKFGFSKITFAQCDPFYSLTVTR